MCAAQQRRDPAVPAAALLQVWQDEHKLVRNDPRYLTIWRPVAPAGYVPMGMVANAGPMPPPVDCVRCVRADAVSSVGTPACRAAVLALEQAVLHACACHAPSGRACCQHMAALPTCDT